MRYAGMNAAALMKIFICIWAPSISAHCSPYAHDYRVYMRSVVHDRLVRLSAMRRAIIVIVIIL